MNQDTQSQIHEWRNAIVACAQLCDECSDDMIGMDHKGDSELMERCIRLCRECADVCTLTGRWMSRVSPLDQKLYDFCAEVCDECAQACEQHASHHALCGPCGEKCRQCADTCRRMSESTAKAN
jgi:hypothetical protein